MLKNKAIMRNYQSTISYLCRLLKMKDIWPDGGGSHHNFSTQDMEAADIWEFEPSMVCKAHSRTARTLTQRKPVFKNRNKNTWC